MPGINLDLRKVENPFSVCQTDEGSNAIYVMDACAGYTRNTVAFRTSLLYYPDFNAVIKASVFIILNHLRSNLGIILFFYSTSAFPDEAIRYSIHFL